VPGSVSRPRPAAPSACSRRAHACRFALLGAALLGAALALGGCLQDAHNADKNFDFNNVNDPTTTTASGVVIAGIDYLSTTQTAYIVNASGAGQDMTKWVLDNRTTTHVYTFGTFSLGVGAFVRVHPVTGTDTGTDLYSGPAGPTSPSWSLSDTASLLNSTGATVSSCTVGSPTC
jgi:hypothetical protein